MMSLKAQVQLSQKVLFSDQCSYTVSLDGSIKEPTQGRNAGWLP